MDDLISRQRLLKELKHHKELFCRNRIQFLGLSKNDKARVDEIDNCYAMVINAPSAQPTLYGYNMEHLKLIAEVLRKENLSPEIVAEALTDIGRIASIIRAECEEELKKAVEMCMI